MSITKAQFRWLVTAWVAVLILSIVASFAGESSLPAPLRNYLDAQSDLDLTAARASGILALAALALLALIALAVSIVGLFLFWRFARPLMVVAWIIGLTFQVLNGPVVDSGLTISLTELAAVLSGIILAVIYMTPAKVWFEKPPKQQT